MLGWIIAIIFYLLGGAATYIMSSSWNDITDWGDRILTIGGSSMCPFLACWMIGVAIKECHDEKKEEEERARARC